ncbi:tRNA (adenine-N1)-methyltransferase [Canibacter sp. lx-72]|uniref:tRNA (adenine-N1)-methyltransferase n=1 Tax=Canibacter zhuwentaonis TaxID=2837491 RepID=UPI001BDC1EFF|nr:tRNA (adenine-N1)-methyltransferase [Canibacter zhuwentaonis]MBT1017866.1 tRNA (adenine-N1)-methyltransferase [Canibacter zhuwentaonis]
MSAARGPFVFGDRVQLTGSRNKRYTITLTPDGEFHTHRGVIPHHEIVGRNDASVLTTSGGEEFLAIRPLLADFVMAMPRGAAIVYPKDAAQIVSQADIAPGLNIVEAGVGSGALTLHLLRAVSSAGTVHSIERRAEFAEIASANVTAFYGGAAPNWQLSVGDFQDVLPATTAPGSVDRVVLDMLAPWECVAAAATALVAGGVIISYVATVTQLSRFVETVRKTGQFTHPQASETMVRTWHVEGLAVRPDHRMVGHTGFLITARKLSADTVLPELKRRASKSEYSAEDLEIWTPGMVRELHKSEKVLRKKVRDAQKFAAARTAPAGSSNHNQSV